VTSAHEAAFEHVLEALATLGLLLESDAALPSVVSLVVGEPVRGSWWGHPRGNEIYHVTDRLADHPDVMLTKLVSGKVTYVARRLWPAVVAVGAARERWQLDGLSEIAKKLLDALSRDGELSVDAIPGSGGSRKDSPREAARELERRLLAYGEQVHTERGAHAKRLESWEHRAARVGVSPDAMTVEQAKATIEGIVARVNERFDARGRLPWSGAKAPCAIVP